MADIQRSHGAALNVVQCSGATMELANMMEGRFGIPSIRVSYFGVEDMAEALYSVARHFNNPALMRRARHVVKEEVDCLMPQLQEYRKALSGKKAAIYVGGAFKAFSLVKAFRLLGMNVVMVGSQTGTKEDYDELEAITDDGTIIVDDANPLELSAFIKQVELYGQGYRRRLSRTC